ncbi:CDP-alcohol phosphatidyltransferase family protein [Arsenicitalea aurantiaca]|uniref:CDP-alcohol phosphatidyltransferase family protein n=1 Tax=Arsenicitalea aurantiaca TaxID=1783274 RepID=A0A433XB90_9HYPH|nr:CDP-alcohol phosphatidyltransferase family protein [Arsenicitalea aurantiaca]RUT31324.1 CDP-alcohol phosphatidyltransferase family protein [Arsenicitalea aurantiaca]
MLDTHMRRLIDPPLDRAGRALADAGIGANQVTLAGLVIGLGAAIAIGLGWFVLALVLVIVSRLLDGLDGAVARRNGVTDFGGFLDIACDFAFYGAVPLAFAIHDPAQNGLAAALLLAAFYVNGTSFLGYAVLAERRRMSTDARGLKTLYFTGGLLEGTETIAFFIAFVIWPDWFWLLALVFAAGCLVTTASRVMLAWKIFGSRP